MLRKRGRITGKGATCGVVDCIFKSEDVNIQTRGVGREEIRRRRRRRRQQRREVDEKKEEEGKGENSGSSFDLSSYRPSAFPLPWSWSKSPKVSCVVLLWGRASSLLLDFPKGPSPACTWMSVVVPSVSEALAKALSHFGH